MKFLYLLPALMLVVLISLFSVTYWQGQYPLFLEFYDIAYHVNSAVGLERCGGFTPINFWAGFSSQGTVISYFPFFHIVGLLILSTGVDPYFLTYWVSWILLPLSLISVLLFAFRAYGARIGLYAVILLSLSPVWMVKQWGMPPQALVYVVTPIIFLALVEKRFITALILTLCCMATHFTGIFLLPFLILYALQNRDERRPLFIMLGALLLIGSPFIWFGLQRIKSIQLVIGLLGATLPSSIEGSLHRIFDVKTEIHVYLGWLAVLGFIICYWRRKRFLILPSYFLALFPLAWTAQEIKFWGTPSLFIFSLLGAVALGTLHEFIEKARLGKIIGMVFFIFVILAGHGLFSYLSKMALQIKTPMIAFLKSPDMWERPKLTFSMDDRQDIINLVKEEVGPDEFFWIDSSNNINNYVGLESRRSTVASVNRERNAMNLVEGIKLVVSKELPSADYKKIRKINEEYNAYILADESKAARIDLPQPMVKTEHLKIIFLVFGVLILADVFRLRRRKGLA